MTDANPAEPDADARRAHLAAKQVLTDVRATWGADTPTSTLPTQITDATNADGVAGLASLYIFAARVGGRHTDDPEIATKWLRGWTGARARVPDDGRAALDAGIAFATRLHTAMGLSDDE